MKQIIPVQNGDTLSGLALAHLGDARRWPELYRINERIIVAEQRRYPEARKHMLGPHWIFPGTVLTMPERDGGKG